MPFLLGAVVAFEFPSAGTAYSVGRELRGVVAAVAAAEVAMASQLGGPVVGGMAYRRLEYHRKLVAGAVTFAHSAERVVEVVAVGAVQAPPASAALADTLVPVVAACP